MPNVIDIAARPAAPRRRCRDSRENTRYARVAGVLVATALGLDPRDLMGRTRGTPATARARQIAMYLAHVAVPMSLTDAARAFGRDRTTAAYACRVIEHARDESDFDQWLAILERRLDAALAGGRA